MKRTLTVSESRKMLPRLIQEVARGGGPFYIGVRGAPTAVLASLEDFESRRLDATASIASEGGPWDRARVEVIEPVSLAEDVRALRGETSTSATRRWDAVDPPPCSPSSRRRRR